MTRWPLLTTTVETSPKAGDMPRSIIDLPPSVNGDYTVYLNGVAQEEDVDFQVEGRTLVFDRSLRKDRISGWRWFLGAWGVGTYRQDDTIDLRYEVDGEMHVAHALPITISDDGPTDEAF